MERKRGRIRRVKHWKVTLAILAALAAAIALADDFKTNNGKECYRPNLRDYPVPLCA